MVCQRRSRSSPRPLANDIDATHAVAAHASASASILAIVETITGSQCASAVQRTFEDAAPAAMVLRPCAPAPSEAQQFQYNPATGALRPKVSSCIATSQGESAAVQYRDCCAALCPSPAS